MKRVLVISPHPDDESIGCGGTIRRHVVNGDQVHVVFLTSGEKGGHGRIESETIKLRERESAAAQRILGVQQIEFYREPDGALRSRPALIKRLVDTLRTWRPNIIYVPHQDEAHSDHRAAARLVLAAIKKVPRPRPAVLMYEVWTPLRRMDEIVDITPYVQVKRRAIRAYRSQCAVMDFDAAILGLNRYRGEMFCWPEGEYAEVFATILAPQPARSAGAKR
jgi:LmbE family N-acetylglucosaminyl deacetylase